MTGSSRPGRVADRLAAAAAAAVVGRDRERARLTALLAAREAAVVFVHGEGGIGKTTLADGVLGAAGLRRLTVPGREVEPTVAGVLGAIGQALGTTPPRSGPEAADAVAAAGVDVLVVESFERLAAVEDWLRDELVVALPGTTTTLVLGRRAPGLGWRTGPGWRHLVAEVQLGRMDREDVVGLVARRGLSSEQATVVDRFARGHPLALELVAEALARRAEPPGSVPPPEIVEELYEVLLDDVDDAERTLVETVWALPRITRPGLAAVLGEPDVEPAWQRLRRLPFVRTTDDGFVLDALTRAVVARSVELRDPLLARRLCEQAHQLRAANRAGPAPGRLASLTPREREVLTLLARGLTNRELAAELFISERTANRHVSSIFAKLGVGNRTAAARVAHDSGVAP